VKRNDKSNNETQIRMAIEEALQDLARKGVIVDSGKRRWSERTGQYQIIWMLANAGETLH
jgi:hypothetical protein